MTAIKVSKALKFCMVTTFYPPYNFGGDGIFVYCLANALAAEGHKVHVIHDVDAFNLLAKKLPMTSPSSHPNITLHPLHHKHLAALDLILTHQLGRPVGKQEAIQKILEQTNFDIIHFHNISLLGGPAILKYGRAIKLCTLHDHWFVCTMHVLWRFNREACTQRTCLRCTLASHRLPQWWRYMGAIDRAVQHVDAFIAPSRFVRQSYLANGFPAPIRCLPHFSPDIEVTSEEDAGFNYTHPRPYFLFVGRLEKIKGVQVLLDQFRTYDAADLLIVGTGIYEDELRQMARGLNHVYFLGSIAHDQLKGIYRRAIAVIVPSLCYETFGLVPIEAFSMGTPVIVHGIGALPEVIADGGGIVYSTPAELLEAMEVLRTQPQLRRQLGTQAEQNFKRNYTQEIHLKRYYNLISELISAQLVKESTSSI